MSVLNIQKLFLRGDIAKAYQKMYAIAEEIASHEMERRDHLFHKLAKKKTKDNPSNYMGEYFEEMVLFAKELGVSLYVDRFVPVGRGEQFKDILIPTKEMIEYINKIIEKYKNQVRFFVEENIEGGECTAGKTHASILVDGTVVPCGHFRYDSQYYMGNIREKPFKEIWDSFNPDILMVGCNGCKLFDKCKGGCRAFAHKLGLTYDPIFCEEEINV